MSALAATAVCVSYDCADLLRRALTSLVAQDVPAGMEIIVVDNASPDDSADVAASFPEVDVLRLPRNAGFGAANNAGAVRAKGDYLLFVNPDTETPPGLVATLLDFMEERPAAAAVGPKIVGRDGKLQRFCARRAPNFLNMMFLVSGLEESRFAGSSLTHRYYPRPFYDAAPARAEVLSGAFILVRRRAFEAVGGFDEGYFLYSEDVDLCMRLGRAGGELWYVPAGPVSHYTGGSRRLPNPLVVAESHRSLRRYARTWFGPAAGALVTAWSGTSLWLRRFGFAVLGVAWRGGRRRARLYREVLASLARPARGPDPA
ncbi:MAG: glycosyltransferase family 2 protein [Candidatus Zixiibacteriota bacterium]|jgi:GT2 family glycosyltransferase